jgi:hypothetical protein
MFSQHPGVLLCHQGSWLRGLTSAARTFCPRGCSCSQIAIGTQWIMAHSSSEKRIPKIDINSAQVYICDPRNWSTCSEALKRSLRRDHKSFLKFQTAELVRGAFTNPISPPPRGISWEESGSGFFLLQTEKRVDSQSLDIILTTFEVMVGRGFG